MIYTVNFNTDAGDREAGLQHVVALYNAAVASRNAALPEGEPLEPTLDAAQFLQKNFDAVLDSYAVHAAKQRADEMKEKFERADQATRDQIETLLAEKAEVNE